MVLIYNIVSGVQRWRSAGTTFNSNDDADGNDDDDDDAVDGNADDDNDAVDGNVDLLALHLRLAELKVVTRFAFPTTQLRVGDLLILNCGEVLMSVCYCCFV